MAERRDSRWLLLIHQIPPKPDYFRVKIWRRLQRIGAVAVKNSVYVLPKSDSTLEDFQWIAREIAEGGGEASLCEAAFVEGLNDAHIESLFRAARDADYAAVAEEARDLTKKLRSRHGRNSEGELDSRIVKLRSRLSEIVEIDFFDSLGRQPAEGLVSSLERRTQPDEQAVAAEVAAEYRGRTWVTRKGIHVDRMASAWLIRRFIDRDCVFKFVPARGYALQKGEVRFDMFDAEFTHQGDRCTAEVLMARFAPKAALRPIAEIVHNIDLKDDKFERPETAGVEAMITGICTRSKSDEERLERGSALFDDLLEFFSRRQR
ncbi:MAG TPA: chromate resistance protein ChrB domain-containing protein [Candidatus Binataceae bacterium]|nr:chromate resistance protein ChrB domain-containing protein [Candidatus Binataceae bacterium]